MGGEGKGQALTPKLPRRPCRSSLSLRVATSVACAAAWRAGMEGGLGGGPVSAGPGTCGVSARPGQRAGPSGAVYRRSEAGRSGAGMGGAGLTARAGGRTGSAGARPSPGPHRAATSRSAAALTGPGTGQLPAIPEPSGPNPPSRRALCLRVPCAEEALGPGPETRGRNTGPGTL